MDPKSPSKTKKSIWVFFQSHRIVKFCIIFLAILLISVGIYYGFGLFGKIQVFYTVVVDCGSTGTRVNVYKLKLNYENIKDLPILLGSYPHELDRNKNNCGYHCMQTKPGLDKFVGNYSGVRNSLIPLLRWAEKIIPKNRHRNTPVFVLATAGLRRLKEEDRIRVLDDMKRVVNEHPFKWKRDWIRVLSGKEEAYYGWVALNFKMGYLNSSGFPTLGLLDLGGSSLQVVTETNEVRNDSEVLVSKIGGFEHKLRLYSLSGFGLNKAFDRTLSMLVKVDGSGSYVRHPCLGLKIWGNYTCSSCSKGESLLSLVGDPNWEKCKVLAQAMAMNTSIVDWSVPRLDSSCQGKSRIEGEDILNIFINTTPGFHYHALSGFFAVYNTLNLKSKSNLTQIREKARHLCSTIWSTDNTISGNQYCFKALYLASLIEDGLCLKNADITFGPGDISWTLGACLVEGGLWREIDGLKTLEITRELDFVVSSPIFVFVILVMMVFVVYYFQLKLPMPGKRSVGVEMPLPSYAHSKSKHRPY